MITTISKEYIDIPYGHRQPFHDGHCRKVHGHNMSVVFTFGATERDENSFVLDFGKLKPLKGMLDYQFDHRLLISPDDPELPFFREMEAKGLCDLREMKSSAEDLAEWIYAHAEPIIEKLSEGKAFLVSVEVFEDSKNAARCVGKRI